MPSSKTLEITPASSKVSFVEACGTALATIEKALPGDVKFLRAIYDTDLMVIIKGRKIYRVSDEVDFKRMAVITADYKGRPYGPVYIAVPNGLVERNVTERIIVGALADQSKDLVALTGPRGGQLALNDAS